MTHASSPLDQPMPARGPDPDATLAEKTGGRGPGKLTIALGALAVLAVGVLVGVVVRGSVGGDTATATTAAGSRAGGFPGAAGYGQAAAGGEGFPGGAAAGGQRGDATAGTVSDLSGSTFTLTTDDGTTVHVTIGSDTTVTVEATGTTSGALADGDTVTVQGTESAGTIAATAVREGSFGAGFGQRGTQQGTQPNA
jgi:hypothetical protein